MLGAHREHWAFIIEEISGQELNHGAASKYWKMLDEWSGKSGIGSAFKASHEKLLSRLDKLCDRPGHCIWDGLLRANETKEDFLKWIAEDRYAALKQVPNPDIQIGETHKAYMHRTHREQQAAGVGAEAEAHAKAKAEAEAAVTRKAEALRLTEGQAKAKALRLAEEHAEAQAEALRLTEAKIAIEAKGNEDKSRQDEQNAAERQRKNEKKAKAARARARKEIEDGGEQQAAGGNTRGVIGGVLVALSLVLFSRGSSV
jgi:hypothetical protein